MKDIVSGNGHQYINDGNLLANKLALCKTEYTCSKWLVFSQSFVEESVKMICRVCVWIYKVRRKLDNLYDPVSYVQTSPYFVFRVEPAVVFTSDMWRTDVLFNRMTHSPGELRDRHRDGEKDPTHSLFYAKEKEWNGIKSSVRCKWIIEVSQPLRLKKDNPFTTPTSKNDAEGRVLENRRFRRACGNYFWWNQLVCILLTSGVLQPALWWMCLYKHQCLH